MVITDGLVETVLTNPFLNQLIRSASTLQSLGETYYLYACGNGQILLKIPSLLLSPAEVCV